MSVNLGAKPFQFDIDVSDYACMSVCMSASMCAASVATVCSVCTQTAGSLSASACVHCCIGSICMLTQGVRSFDFPTGSSASAPWVSMCAIARHHRMPCQWFLTASTFACRLIQRKKGRSNRIPLKGTTPSMLHADPCQSLL